MVVFAACQKVGEDIVFRKCVYRLSKLLVVVFVLHFYHPAWIFVAHIHESAAIFKFRVSCAVGNMGVEHNVGAELVACATAKTKSVTLYRIVAVEFEIRT